MKVRVRQTYGGAWAVEVWRWYIPIWWYITSESNFDNAMMKADKIKNPTIVEVQ